MNRTHEPIPHSTTAASPRAALRALAAAGVLATTLALAGCDTVRAPYAARNDTVAQANYPKVVVEAGLSPYLAINQPVQSTENGIMKVSVPARLLSNPGEFSRVQYKFTFFNGPTDAGGTPLRTQTEWRYMVMEPRNQIYFEGNALDNTAKDWRLEVRSAR